MRARAESGFTMVEMMIVIAIISILILAVTDSYRSWSRRYRAENSVKEMYANLMDARARALQKKRMHFVVLTGTEYRIYEDTSPAPDGDRTLDTAADTLVLRGTPAEPIQTFPAGGIAFDTDGVSSIDSGFIRISSPVRSDYDCIALRRTRIKLGQMDDAGAVCVEK